MYDDAMPTTTRPSKPQPDPVVAEALIAADTFLGLAELLRNAASQAEEALRAFREAAVPVLLTTSDVAAQKGVSRSRVHTAHEKGQKGKYPPADFTCPSFGPLWLPESLWEIEDEGEPVEPVLLLAMADIAAKLGIQRQSIQGRRERGTFPTPSYRSRVAGPLWLPEVLVEAGVLPSDPEAAPAES